MSKSYKLFLNLDLIEASSVIPFFYFLSILLPISVVRVVFFRSLERVFGLLVLQVVG